MLIDKPFIFPEGYTEKIRFLCVKRGSNEGPNYRSIGIFNRYLDLYLVGAALGISLDLLGKNMPLGNGLTIFTEQLGKARNEIVYLYSLAMLNYKGEDENLSLKERYSNAFELINTNLSDASPEIKEKAEKCEKIFYRYIYGGIDYIYDHFKDLKDKSEISVEALDDLILDLVKKNIDFDVTNDIWNSYY